MGNESVPLESPAVRHKIAETQERNEAAERAAATPLPGPLADAFAIAPDVPCGTYKVRPFLECDFEFLKALEHPLYEILIDLWQNTKTATHDFFPRGQQGWEICYLFTHTVDEVEALLKNGAQALKDSAKKEFGKMPTAAIAALNKAANQQCLVAFSTTINYGASESPDDGSKKNVPAPPG